jgi:hypothetical protein
MIAGGYTVLIVGTIGEPAAGDVDTGEDGLYLYRTSNHPQSTTHKNSAITEQPRPDAAPAAVPGPTPFLILTWVTNCQFALTLVLK